MIHAYTRRDYPDGTKLNRTVKLLCTGKFTRFYVNHVAIASATQGYVTCPDCLKILIPKAEEAVNVMRMTLKRALLIREGNLERGLPADATS